MARAKRAAVYCRMSRDRVGAGLGIDRQRQDCEALAERLGWTVISVHSDNDLSAYSGKPRPGYKALLAEITAGKVDAVLAWHTDRLHRSPRELEDYIDLCEAHKITTQTVRAGSLDLTNASGRMVARMLGAAARQEVELKSERTKRAKLQSAEAGKWLGGTFPFGWTRRDDGSVILDKPVARRIQKATADILSGVSLGSITREWNEAGFATANGGKWTYTKMRAVLLRARNAGLIELNGEIVGKAAWPAIENEDSWRALRRMLSDPSRRRSQSTRRKWLLAGIAVCGKEDCAQPLRSASVDTTRAIARRAVYRCPESHVSCDAVELDKLVTKQVLAMRRSPRFWQRFNEAASADEARSAELQDEALAIRTRIEQVPVEFADDATITPAMVRQTIARLTHNLRDVEQKLAEATVMTHRIELDPKDVERQWKRLTLEQQRSVIQDTAKLIVVYPTKRGIRTFDIGRVIFSWRVEAIPEPEDFAGMA
jgi:site-specific DNA recombinase